MTTNLEQIAKQISLLNRLLELLEMQQLPYHPSQEDEEQKGWIDELVRVARELNEFQDGLSDFAIICLSDISGEIMSTESLEAILNKYGRSLTE